MVPATSGAHCGWSVLSPAQAQLEQRKQADAAMSTDRENLCDYDRLWDTGLVRTGTLKFSNLTPLMCTWWVPKICSATETVSFPLYHHFLILCPCIPPQPSNIIYLTASGYSGFFRCRHAAFLGEDWIGSQRAEMTHQDLMSWQGFRNIRETNEKVTDGLIDEAATQVQVQIVLQWEMKSSPCSHRYGLEPQRAEDQSDKTLGQHRPQIAWILNQHGTQPVIEPGHSTRRDLVFSSMDGQQRGKSFVGRIIWIICHLLLRPGCFNRVLPSFGMPTQVLLESRVLGSPLTTLHTSWCLPWVFFHGRIPHRPTGVTLPSPSPYGK